MPLYEYLCTSCSYAFETLVSTTGSGPSQCPECGKESLEKQFSTFAVSTQNSPSMPSCEAAGSCQSRSCPLAKG